MSNGRPNETSSPPSILEGLAHIRGAVAADLRGALLDGAIGLPQLPPQRATRAAAAIADLAAAGGMIGLARLETLLVKGPRSAAVTTIRADAFLLVAVDPTQPTAPIEKALHSWVAPAKAEPPASGPVGSASRMVPPALPVEVSPSASSSLLARMDQREGCGANAMFSGQLSLFALPDLLEFLRSGRRAGLLVCNSAAGMAALRLRDGWITGAASPGTPSIGQLLFRARKVSMVALRAVASPSTASPPTAEQPDQLMGEQLVREGLVDAEAVQEALKQQIGLALRELVAWKDGEFAFTCDEESGRSPSEVEGIAVKVDPQVVLLNLFREMDESSRDAGSTTGAEL